MATLPSLSPKWCSGLAAIEAVTVVRSGAETQSAPPSFLDWLPIQNEMDLVISDGALYVMKEKGHLKQLPLAIRARKFVSSYRGQRRSANFCWDGRYIWGVSPGDTDQFLAVMDPETEQVW